nr:VP4 protein [Bat rotavirus]
MTLKMALRSLLLTFRSSGERIDLGPDKQSSSIRDKESQDNRATRILEKDGDKHYCFKNLDPKYVNTRMGQYPFEGQQENANDGLAQVEVWRKVFDDGSKYNSSLEDVRNKLVQLYADGKRVLITFQPEVENENDVFCRYEAVDVKFQSGRLFNGVVFSIIEKITNDTIHYTSNEQHSPSSACALIMKMFSQKESNKLATVHFNKKVIVTLYQIEERAGHENSYTLVGANFVNLTLTSSSTVRYYSTSEFFLKEGTPQAKMERKRRNKQLKTIISETKDGFWKIMTENYQIQLKMAIEGYGIMGGTFGNWLVDTGFRTVEINYEYERDGKQIYATTVTSVRATRKAGTNSPEFGQLQYSGRFMVLSRGDIVTVHYTEREWSLANAVYAKNFASDFTGQFDIAANASDLIVHTNVLPNTILNTPGRAYLKYLNGGFGQIDTTDYTGMSLVFRFQCTNEDLKSGLYPEEIANTFACIGQRGRSVNPEANGLFRTLNIAVSGFGSCYPRKEKEFNVNVTYTTLLPSDPSFVTGGSDYSQTVTYEIETSIIALQSQVNEMLARMNISDVTSGVMTAFSIATSFPQIFEGLTDALRAVNSAFSKIKGKFGKVAKRLRGKRTIKLLDDDVSILETPTVTNSVISSRRPSQLSNMFTDDETFSAVHSFISKNSGVAQEIEYVQPVVLSRFAESTPPAIAPASSITTKNLEKLSTIVNTKIRSDSILEFNQINNTISILDSSKHLAQYAVDPDIIDAVLSKMVGGHARSLFSLKVRKNLLDVADKDAFVKYSYNDLVSKLLNDKELIDVTNNLSIEKQIELAKEFTELLRNMFS